MKLGVAYNSSYYVLEAELSSLANENETEALQFSPFKIITQLQKFLTLIAAYLERLQLLEKYYDELKDFLAKNRVRVHSRKGKKKLRVFNWWKVLFNIRKFISVINRILQDEEIFSKIEALKNEER